MHALTLIIYKHEYKVVTEVQLDNRRGVDGEPLVGVHYNTEQTRVRVDQLSLDKKKLYLLPLSP